MKRKIAIFGGTGLIGRALVRSLILDNYEVSVFSRDIKRASDLFHDIVYIFPIDHSISETLENQEILINLSGENISRRWTKSRKRKIIDSRVKGTENLVKVVNGLKNKPKLFIQGSATGYFPFSDTQIYNEDASEGNSFLSRVVVAWEAASDDLDSSVKKIILRTGVVITAAGGMLPKLIRPIKLFAGGIPGKGDNWISWIHIDDVVGVIRFLLENDRSEGVYNLTSPNPVMMKELIRFCGSTLKRPVLFRIPEFLIRLFFGEMGRETILSSQRVVTKRLNSAGYQFKYPDFRRGIEKELL